MIYKRAKQGLGVEGQGGGGGLPGDEDDEKRRKSPFTPCCELLNKFSTFEKYPSIE